MDKTKIDWCDSSWNPVTGCLHNCEYCYARSIANRFGFHANEPNINERILEEIPISGGKKVPYLFDFQPTLHKYRLDEYLHKKGRNIFVCSMADLFGEWVPDSWINEVFETCRRAPQHNYLFLTKNYMRASDFKFEKNWWIGRTYTSNQDTALCYGDPWSTDITERANQFLSIEPLLGDVTDLPYYAHEYGFKWVIIGAETGNRKSKVVPKREWIERIVKDCRFRKVPIFMKSSLSEIWGEPLIQEFPEQLRRQGE
ncbi:DUF5131 family protein [Lacrimispora sp.]|uniref:DUF5131 family protein n=1 Tax=Lacrimispora sp. TaxID=2719234 RepID=UPI00289B9D07|nr:DUF5131 family protein [Lacrimispora sp.]